MAIELVPLPLPPTGDPSRLSNFGREVKGIDPARFTQNEFKEIEDALYKYGVLLFRGANLTPEKQYALTKAFDPVTENYGHGNNKTEGAKKSILHPYLKTIPRVPQVQLIGEGVVHDHEGIPAATLKHPSHKTFHKTRVSDEDEAQGVTRFYRWHMDAALYDLSPPKVTTLYGLQAPQGPPQTCRYDDGTGDELMLPLGSTAFVSGKTMFELLPADLKSLAVRLKVKYAPHTYEWMTPAHALPTGLGLEVEGLEVPYDKLPTWEESKIKVYPVLWKNPVTSALHFMVHPCGVSELIIDPLPESVPPSGREKALYPDGAHIKELEIVRRLLYMMQRPAIAPELVYPHDWHDDDLIIFHNRGVMHSVTGAFSEGQVRVFHQCNLAAFDEPVGPDREDVRKWARGNNP